MESRLAFATFLLVPVVLCLTAMTSGWERRKRYVRVRDATVPSSVQSHDGTVLVQGKAEQASDTVRSLLSDEESLLFASMIHEYNRPVKFYPPWLYGWWRHAYRSASTRFTLYTADETFVVPRWTAEEINTSPWDAYVGLKYPSTYGLTLSDRTLEIDTFETTIEVPQLQRNKFLSEHVSNLEEYFDLDSPQKPWIRIGRETGTRRYDETVIRNGDTITVFGTVSNTDSDRHPVLTSPDDGPMILTSLSPGELTHRYRRLYRWWFHLPAVIATGILLVILALLVA